jgi:predicted nucleotidyltransferase
MRASRSRVERFLNALVAWAAEEAGVETVLLVGSHARGAATPASDVDLLLLVTDPRAYVEDPGWAGAFGAVERSAVEDWGKVISLRVWYADGPEVEFGFATPDWMASPFDDGTRKVLEDGFRVLYRRSGRRAKR